MSVSDCVSLELHIQSSPSFFVHAAYSSGSVLLWQHSDTLCTSGFRDDIMFAHNDQELAT